MTAAADAGRRVLVLGDANNPHTVRWSNALAAAGWSVVLFGLHDRLSSSTRLDPGISIESAGVPISTAQRGAGALRKFGYLRAVRRLRRAVRSFRPDVVHAHFASSYGLLSCLVPARGRRVVSVWGSDVFAFPDRSPLHRGVIRAVLGRATRVYSSSELMAARCRTLTRTPVGVIPFGVDTDVFRPGPIRQPPFTIGTVKSLEEVYGIDVLITAFASVRQALAPQSVRLLIVGDGTRRAELEMLAQRLGVDDAIEWAGRVPWSDVPALLGRTGVFANLSRWESFGVSVLEAASCELPVVSTDVGGLPEVVEPHVTGLLVPPDDAQAAAEALLRLCRDPARRAELGRNGRRMVQSRFEWRQCVETQIAEYATLPRRSPAADR